MNFKSYHFGIETKNGAWHLVCIDSLNRTILELKRRRCKYWQYPKEL